MAREGEFDDDGYYISESISLDEDGNFEVSLQGLRPMTEYQCRVNIAYGGLCSDVWSFTMPNPYDQTFDLNGGTGTADTQVVYYGQTANQPNAPTMDKYVFADVSK